MVLINGLCSLDLRCKRKYVINILVRSDTPSRRTWRNSRSNGKTTNCYSPALLESLSVRAHQDWGRDLRRPTRTDQNPSLGLIKTRKEVSILAKIHQDQTRLIQPKRDSSRPDKALSRAVRIDQDHAGRTEILQKPRGSSAIHQDNPGPIKSMNSSHYTLKPCNKLQPEPIKPSQSQSSPSRTH